MALSDGFIFGGNTDLTYEQLKQRRAIAAALASRQRGYPKNVGEGLSSLGNDFAEAMQWLALNRAEQKQRGVDTKAKGDLVIPGVNSDGTTTEKPQVKPVPSADQKIEPPKPAPPAQTSTLDEVTGMDVAADAGVPWAPSGMDIAGDMPAVAPGRQAAVETTPPPEVQPDVAAAQPPTISPAVPPETLASMRAQVADPLAPIKPLPGTQAQLTPNQVTGPDTGPAQGTVGGDARETFFDPNPVRNRVTAALVQPAAGPSGAVPVAGPAAGTDLQTGQVQLPTETADIPLPRGNPRTTGGVQATMDAVFSRQGYTPAAIAGIKRNVNDESRFDYTLRHPDQPRFSGEARYAHGLYQEGGDEWNNFVKWVDREHPGSDWRDPHLQSLYVAERLKDPQYARTFEKVNSADNSGQAADAFLRGYLKPADQYLQQRSAAYLGGERSSFGPDRPITVASGDGTPVTGNRAGDRVGGAPQGDDTRDAVAEALLAQQQQQPQQQAQAATEDGQDERLKDVLGLTPQQRLPQRPTASLGRTGVASDTALPVLAPMGALAGSEGGPMPSAPAPIDVPPAGPRVVTPQQSPTVTDIAPAPDAVTPGEQYAQARPQINRNADPNAQITPPPASGSAPVIEPIPPRNMPAFPDPGPAPVPPREVPRDPRQIRALEIANDERLSPEVRAQAKQTFDLWEKDRTERRALELQDYQTKYTAWAAAKDKQRTWGLEAPKRELEQMKDRLEIEAKQLDNAGKPLEAEKKRVELEKLKAETQKTQEEARIATQYGGLPANAVFERTTKDADSARSAALGYDAANRALAILKSGKAITGFGADARLNIRKFADLMGFQTEGIPETEIWRTQVAPMVSSVLKSTVGSTQISNTDREFAERGAGASSNLDERSMVRVMEITRQRALDTLNNHQNTMETVHGPSRAANGMFGVDMGGVDPSDKAKLLAGGSKEGFDAHYGRGAADYILRRERYSSGITRQ